MTTLPSTKLHQAPSVRLGALDTQHLGICPTREAPATRLICWFYCGGNGLREVKCLAQGHKALEDGNEPRAQITVTPDHIWGLPDTAWPHTDPTQPPPWAQTLGKESREAPGLWDRPKPVTTHSRRPGGQEPLSRPQGASSQEGPQRPVCKPRGSELKPQRDNGPA